MIGLLGKRPLPVLPPWGTGLLAAPLRALGLRIPDEMLNQLRFGRGLDNRRYKASGFEYGYTSREAVLAFSEHLRLQPILRGVESTYTYEGEVERFLRRSPLARPPSRGVGGERHRARAVRDLIELRQGLGGTQTGLHRCPALPHGR